MRNAAIEELRGINHNLCAVLAGWQKDRAHAPIIKPQDFADLRAELTRTAVFLQEIGPASAADSQIAKEISACQRHLQQLAQILPSVRERLLAEKARLELARTHLARAAAWAQASRQSL